MKQKWRSEKSVDSSIEPIEQPHDSADTNDLEPLPAPTETFNDTLSDISTIDDEDYKETIKDDIMALYEDCIDELDRENVQMLTMMMYDYFVSLWRHTLLKKLPGV